MSTYMNIRNQNGTDKLAIATCKTRRETQVFADTSDYNVAVDRFSLEHAYLPVFQNHHTYRMRIVSPEEDPDTPDFVETLDIDLDGVTDSEGFGYSLDDFVDSMNVTLSALATTYGGETPTFVLNHDNTVSLITDAGFRAEYQVWMCQHMFANLSLPAYAKISDADEFVRIRLTKDEMVSKTPIAVSCVNRILMLSTGMPIVPEMVGSGARITNDSIAIVTDFNVNADLFHSVNDFYFTASDPKYHRMHRGSFRNVELSFYFTTRADSEIRRVKLLKGGACGVKLRFDLSDTTE